MIHIERVTLEEHKDYDEVQTEVKIEGTGEVIKEEIKALLLHCIKDKNLVPIVLFVLKELMYDN